MHFGLIDQDAAYRKGIRYHLEVEWPDAEIVEHARLADAAPESLVGLDAILVAFDARRGDGLGELRSLLDRSAFPPVVLFVENGDELLAVDALKAGAASYFPKRRVTHHRLIDALRVEIGAGGRGRRPQLAGVHGQYRFAEVLHATPMASVYRATLAGRDDETLAVKLLHYVPDAGGEKLFERFLQEYELIAGLDHPNVVRIRDFGVADDHAFIAMEYLAGGRLSDRLGRPLPVRRALDCLRQVAGALDAVHGAGILHRDLKPANIMFRDDGSVALIDFGLARWLQLEAALTGHGEISGTPYYMSPEQGHGLATDVRSDLYSLGCICYEMLTGSQPFTASTPMGVIYQHAHAPRPRLGPGLATVQPLLDRLMAVDPVSRFASARALLDEIEALGPLV